MVDKTIKLTLTEANGQTGLILESDAASYSDIFFAFHLGICAMAEKVKIPVEVCAAMVVSSIAESVNIDSTFFDLSGLPRKKETL